MDFINGNQNIRVRQLSVNEQGNITWVSYNNLKYVLREGDYRGDSILFVSETYKLTSADDPICSSRLPRRRNIRKFKLYRALLSIFTIRAALDISSPYNRDSVSHAFICRDTSFENATTCNYLTQQIRR